MGASRFLILVPLLGLGELGLHVYFARRAPGVADYAALAPVLLKLKRPGVPVVVAPAWAEPLLRQAAPAAFPLAELARADNRAAREFLEVSLLGQSAPELSGFAEQQSQRVGAFRLSLRQNPQPEPTLFDFVSGVETGAVEVFDDVSGQRSHCALRPTAQLSTGGLHGHVAYPQQRYDCRGGRFVGVTLVEDERYRPRRCIAVQLPASGRVVLRFNGVPVSRKLQTFSGFSYFLERDASAPQVELEVSEVGRTLGTWRARGGDGWVSSALARSGPPGAIEVSLRRLAPSRSDFCFAAEAR